MAASNPAVVSYDPAFAYELAAVVDEGLQRMYGHEDPLQNEDVFYYITLYNEAYDMPPQPDCFDSATATPT
jgi:pyruvate dehydrogenase E1 component